MSKKFLGIICLLYSGLIIYILASDKIKNFLAPQMQIYIKIALILLLIVGIIVILNDDKHYKFKITDFVLLLPLIILLLAGDGRLSSSFASNRTNNLGMDNKFETKEVTPDEPKEEIKEEVKPEDKKEKKKEEKKEVPKEEQPKKTYNFSNPDIDVVDSNYNELSNYITFEPKAEKFTGQTIKVKGFALLNSNVLPDGYIALGKYVISCCAADASFTGFVVKNDGNQLIDDKWYEVQGVLEKGKASNNQDIMYIRIINAKEINDMDEEVYVYPCGAYDNGECKTVMKYNLEY